MKRKLLSAAVLLSLSAVAGSASAYYLPNFWKMKYENFEVVTPEPVNWNSTGSAVQNFIANNTVEDNWAIFQITSIIDRSTSSVVWSAGDGGQWLTGILWGLATTDTTAIDTDSNGNPDLFVARNTAGTQFIGGTSMTDLDGDSVPDAGMAIYLHTAATNPFDPTLGPTARDLSAVALADGIPDYPTVTTGILQALFKMETGVAHKISPPSGSGLVPLTLVSGDAATVPFTGKGSGYANLLNPGSYGSPFDYLVAGAETSLLGGRDIFYEFNLRGHPDTGLTNYGWSLNSEDPVFGQAVPEPATLALLGLGLLGLGATTLRRRAV